MKSLLFLFLIGVFIFIPSTVLGAQFRSGNNAKIGEEISEDLYVGGQDVSSTKIVKGDAFLFGNLVTVSGEITEDLTVGASNASIEGLIGDDLRFGVGSIRLNGKVIGDVLGAVNYFALGAGSEVGGGLYLAGTHITLDGLVKGDVRVAADTVVVNGTLERDAIITAKQLKLGPQAKIRNIVYKGDHQALVNPAAQIEGSITFEQRHQGGLNNLRPIKLLYNALTLILLGFVVLFLLKVWAPRFWEEAQIKPVTNALIGLAGIVLVPIAIVILIMTILGMAAALALGAFAALAGIIGLVIGIRWIGQFILKTGSKHAEELGAYALAVIILTFVGILPVVGSLAIFVIFLIGFGTVIRYLIAGLSRKARAH